MGRVKAVQWRSVGVRGFSLLEVLVAISILALALGALYQAAGGSVRNVQRADERSRALLLAQSLLDAHDSVPRAGLALHGTEAGLDWQLQSRPYPTAHEQRPGWPLHELSVSVSWGRAGHGLQLRTLLPVTLHALEQP